ncbi:hypothetical protein X760_05870 [Mesorhizobium sp. LSHC422A00]|nr:hypothetical protein X760_05870 [Mesorhizobium sp. LSHC422A00]
MRQLWLAQTFLRTEQWDKAIEAFIGVAAATSDDLAQVGRNGLSQALAGKKKAADQDAADTASRKVELGRTFLRAGNWDKAIEALESAADSEDDAVAKSARDGILAAVAQKEAAPLGVRAYLSSPFNQWWPIDYIVYAAALVAVLIAMGLIWGGWVGPFVEGVFAFFFKRTNDWKVSVTGNAEEALRNSVFDEFVVTMRELRRYQQDNTTLSAVGTSQARFFAPLSLSDLAGPDLKVQGIDIGRLAAMMQAVRDHYSFQFELRVETLEKHAYVYALLRWGGRTEKVWQIPALADRTVFGYREIGQKLAYVVYGDGLVRT